MNVKNCDTRLNGMVRWTVAMSMTCVIACQAVAQTNAPTPKLASPAPTAVTAPPMSIGPAPGYFSQGFYPVPVYSFDGRPLYLAAQPYGPPAFGPAFGPPVYAGPAPVVVGPALGAPLPAPPQPVPIGSDFLPPATTNYAPTTDFPQAMAGIRRSAGPANLRLSVSEPFLNRVIAQDRIEPGPVRDFILGAEVTGRQTTVSRLRVDLFPSLDKAHAKLVLNGDVKTLTTGVTPQAMIGTAGQQQFSGVKDVYFDGTQFSTRHATVAIRAENKTIGATTPLSGTLFGGLADRIAYRAAERQKAAGEAVARDRLAERLFPTFDGEVDNQLANANRQLEPLRKWLDTMKLLPANQAAWTTDNQLNIEFLVGDTKTAASIPALNDAAEGDAGLRISIHESLLNTFVDRTGLKGLKTTDKKLRELEKALMPYAADIEPADSNESSNTTLKAPELPAGTTSFVTDIEFDEVEPLTFRIERDRLLVTMKAHFKPAGQAVVPPMVVTIPYQTTIVGNKIRVTPGKLRVVAQDRPDPEAPQTITEIAIEKIMQADMIPLEFDRALPASLWKSSSPAPRITSVKSDNGWATITID